MSEQPDAQLYEVRQQIDSVDRRIVTLLAERQKWVLKAGTLKSDEDAVRAPDRVEQVISRIRSLAAETGASPDVVEAAYRALIEAFINLELSEHRARG